MEEMQREEGKAMQNWNGQERRRGPSDDYKGDERRRAAEAMKDMPTGDLTGGDAGMSEREHEKQRRR
jgi:hypothetical protein